MAARRRVNASGSFQLTGMVRDLVYLLFLLLLMVVVAL